MATCREVEVQRETGARVERAKDFIAEECPVALLYNSVPHVVMLASPTNLEDLGVGFTLSEALVGRRDEIQSIELIEGSGSHALHLHIASDRFSELLRKQRNLSGRTGCGLCGVETVEEAIRHPAPVHANVAISRDELHRELAKLHSQQALNQLTGSVHAAAWALPGKGIQVVREDVGRHNALDKVIGALAREGIDCSDGYFIITSRASYEMVQKAATVGVSFLVAVSAPTALAIDLAVETGMTLVGFARAERHVIYTNPQRLLD